MSSIIEKNINFVNNFIINNEHNFNENQNKKIEILIKAQSYDINVLFGNQFYSFTDIFYFDNVFDLKNNFIIKIINFNIFNNYEINSINMRFF